jgi:hypothetical protein
MFHSEPRSHDALDSFYQNRFKPDTAQAPANSVSSKLDIPQTRWNSRSGSHVKDQKSVKKATQK